MPDSLETDYLVVGAGAGGMAFTDELLTHGDATVTLVDRRHAPGGHWHDAYPYVRLHQPSAFYGVSSSRLGDETVDTEGHNAGFYELATPSEILAYYERVLRRRFLPSGRVRFLPETEHQEGGDVVSRLTGARQRIAVRRKIVDTTYMAVEIPATTPPPFEVDDGVRCVPAGALASLPSSADRYVVVGAGKTALDACVWLLETGVAPSAIRWIKPREAWWLNRRFQQPATLVTELYRGSAIQLEAIAAATSMDDLFLRLEAEDVMLRVDPGVPATMFRGAVVSEGELALLRRIQDVVRMGHVRRITRDAIVLDEGSVPTDPGTVHVHCAARALASRPPRAIFEPGRVTLQPVLWGFASYQFALLGVLEALVPDDAEKNALCPPIRYWDRQEDYLPAFLATATAERRWANHPDLVRWSRATRLNPTAGVAAVADEPAVREIRARIKAAAPAALANAGRLLGS